MVLALHFDPVRSELAAPETSATLFFCLATSLEASAAPEFTRSTRTSTLSTSNQELARLDAIPGLFWWSPAMISTFMPLAAGLKSATAILAAATEPAPARSEYKLDMSVNTPIL